MRKSIFHSLAVKIAAIVVLIEIVVLSVIGGIFIHRFSNEVDRRVEERVQIPGSLMANGSLNYSLVANKQWMERLVGQELVEGVVLNVAQRVFYSLSNEQVGKEVSDIPGLNPDWFTTEIKSTFVKHIEEKGKHYLISVSPIFSMDGQTPFLFIYLKVNTTLAEIEKAEILRIVFLGSTAAIILTSLAIFIIFRLSIFSRIRSILTVFKKVESGNMTSRLQGKIFPDEIGNLQNGVNSMIAKLQETLKALQKSEKMYRATVEDIPAMVCRFLPDGNITFSNSEYTKFFKKQVKADVGQNFFASIADDNRANIQQQFSSLSLLSPLVSFTQPVAGLDGNQHWQHWTGRALFNESGEITECQALGRDVTQEMNARNEKDELEKQLHKAQKMQAIGTLAGGIAHDFNNILSGIIGYSELLQLSITKGTRNQHHIEQVLKACHRAKELILQILTFSRQSTVKQQPLQISSIIKETLKLLNSTLPDNIEIHSNLKSPESVVMANPTQIHQALMNLCTNAISVLKSEGGVLEVEMDEEEIYPGKNHLPQKLIQGTYIKVSVKDNGPGMSEEVLERIFEPYFSTKTPHEGTGLGLSLCLGVIESHGGTIVVQSSLGNGSKFSIFLPKVVREPFSEQDIPLPDDFRARQGETILLVDDESVLVDVGKAMLQQLGYKVLSTTDSLAALELFRSHSNTIDLVITDQKMPDLTGAELISKIKKIRADIPIIMCTGYSEVITEQEAKKLGAEAFFMKPVSRLQIASAVHNLLKENEKRYK